MCEIPLVRIKMVKEKNLFYEKRKVNCSSDAVKLVGDMIKDLDRECVVLISMDARCQAIAVEILSIGDLVSAPLDPKSIFKHALLVNAYGVVLLHNHPSGDETPSSEDEKVTKSLQEAGKLLAIKVIDHIVIGEDGTFKSILNDEY